MVNKKRLLILIILITIILGLITGGVVCIYSQTKNFDKVFLHGVYVEDIDIGGLTKEEAKKEIQAKINELNKDKNITLYTDEFSWEIPYEKFEGKYNIDEVLEEAFKYGHDGNMIKRFLEFTSKNKYAHKLSLTHTYSMEKVEELLNEYAKELYIAPQDAKMKRVNKEFVISPEKDGRKLDIEATANAINKAYEKGEVAKVEAVIKTISPNRDSSYFNDVQTPLASFYTTYDNRDQNRNYNLKIGAETINTVIEPGEVFALSNYLEPITAKGGYKSSKVIVNGKLVDGIGGGVCQVASTLYNSVLLTDLEITSRQNHSLPVGYIPLGRDATYATNAIDFKFKNPSKYPVYVESYCENNKLYVNIFGHESLKPKNEIKFESEVVEVIKAPETKYKDDPNLLKGQKVQEVSALDGKRVNLYKYIYKDGKVVDKVLESKSYYRPRAAVVRVGTKEPQEQKADAASSKPKEDSQSEDKLDADSSIMDLYEEQN